MANTMLPSGISVRIREDLIDGVSRTQTTLIIDPMITKGGHRVTMADIGSIGYGKINQGKASEELISWTGITDNITTYTLTGCTWGINFHNLSSDNANIKRHVSGAKFAIMTDMHYVADQFRDNADNVFTNTDPMEFNSNEVRIGNGTNTLDKIIIADNGDANEPFVKYNETSNKWEISNDGVNSYDPEQGGSGVTAGEAISIVGGEVSVKTSEASGVHVTGDEVAIEYQTDPGLSIVDNKLGVKVKADTGLLKDSDGIYLDSFILKHFGDGSDGDVVISSNTSLARDMFYNNLTINNGIILNPNGYCIYVKSELINNGTISRTANNGNNGNNGNIGGSQPTGGSGGAKLSDGTLSGGVAGANGANSSNNGLNGSNQTCLGSNGSNGGAGGSGQDSSGGTASAGGVATSENLGIQLNYNNISISDDNLYRYLRPISSVNSLLLSTSAGSGGGGGGGRWNAANYWGGAGGGAGATGAVIYIAAKILTNNGIISANGGNGGNGGNGVGTDGNAGSGGGGGGAGGNGGTIILIYDNITLGTVNVNGGSKGLKGLRGAGTFGNAVDGQDGQDGAAGKIYKIKL